MSDKISILIFVFILILMLSLFGCITGNDMSDNTAKSVEKKAAQYLSCAEITYSVNICKKSEREYNITVMNKGKFSISGFYASASSEGINRKKDYPVGANSSVSFIFSTEGNSVNDAIQVMPSIFLTPDKETLCSEKAFISNDYRNC